MNKGGGGRKGRGRRRQKIKRGISKRRIKALKRWTGEELGIRETVREK